MEIRDTNPYDGRPEKQQDLRSADEAQQFVMAFDPATQTYRANLVLTHNPKMCDECKRPAQSGWLCKTCNDHLLIIEELKVALRTLDNTITAYFGSSMGSAQDVVAAQVQAKRVLNHVPASDEMVKKESGDA